MNSWKFLRWTFLVILFSSIWVSFAKILWWPKQGYHHQLTPFDFPNSVPLSEWKAKGSQALPMINPQLIKSAHRYQYQKGDILLDIDMRYMVNTDGHVPSFIKNHSPTQKFSLQLRVKNHPSIGYYGLFSDQGRAYLSSCINPRGETTVNHDQFNYNRYHSDLRVDRIMVWLLGQGEIYDRRCLWTQMSISLQQMSTETAYPLLEETWVIWYQWWSPRFPNS